MNAGKWSGPNLFIVAIAGVELTGAARRYGFIAQRPATEGGEVERHVI